MMCYQKQNDEEVGRRKKEEGRRKKEEGRRKRKKKSSITKDISIMSTRKMSV